MIWTFSSILYVTVMSIVYRGELTLEFKLMMWLIVFLIGAIDFNGARKNFRQGADRSSK